MDIISIVFLLPIINFLLTLCLIDKISFSTAFNTGQYGGIVIVDTWFSAKNSEIIFALCIVALSQIMQYLSLPLFK